VLRHDEIRREKCQTPNCDEKRVLVDITGDKVCAKCANSQAADLANQYGKAVYELTSLTKGLTTLSTITPFDSDVSGARKKYLELLLDGYQSLRHRCKVEARYGKALGAVITVKEDEVKKFETNGQLA